MINYTRPSSQFFSRGHGEEGLGIRLLFCMFDVLFARALHPDKRTLVQTHAAYVLFYAELESSFSQTPVRRVMATVLQSPLLIANSKIEFSFPAFVEMHESMVHEKVCSLAYLSYSVRFQVIKVILTFPIFNMKILSRPTVLQLKLLG